MKNVQFCSSWTSSASKRDFSVSGYTVWDRRNEIFAEKCKYDDGTSAI